MGNKFEAEPNSISQVFFFCCRPEHRTGAVAQLKKVRTASKVAWAVMNYTKHSMLVGDLGTSYAYFPLLNSYKNLSRSWSICIGNGFYWVIIRNQCFNKNVGTVEKWQLPTQLQTGLLVHQWIHHIIHCTSSAVAKNFRMSVRTQQRVAVLTHQSFSWNRTNCQTCQ